MILDVEFAFAPSRLPGWMMTTASLAALIAIGDPRHAALRPWRWLWVYLMLNGCLNLLSSGGLLFHVTSLPAWIANGGRLLYLPPLLLGLAAVVGHPRYRIFARVATGVLVVQMLVGLMLSAERLRAIPTIRTSITFLLITTVAAVGVLARVAKVRGAILRDPPTIALIATLLAYATQSAYAPIQRVLAGSEMSMTLRWTRAAVWVAAYALWWHAFREARRQARPA